MVVGNRNGFIELQELVKSCWVFFICRIPDEALGIAASIGCMKLSMRCLGMSFS
jgi:hypothetical protein